MRAILKTLCACWFVASGLGPTAAQSRFSVLREGIPPAERDSLASQAGRILEAAGRFWLREAACVPCRYISPFRCGDLERFCRRVVAREPQLERIDFSDSVLTLRFRPEFYRFGMPEAVYEMYNDWYKAFFSYPQVAQVSVVLTDGTNLAFLPVRSSDAWVAVAGARIRREWFLADIDYGGFLGIGEIEAGTYDNGRGEYDPEKIARKTEAWRKRVESPAPDTAQAVAE